MLEHRKPVIYEAYDETVEAIKLGKLYQTRFDPAPGPPVDAEGKFLPLPEWLLGQPQPADWPSHIHPPHDMELRQ